MKTFVQYGAGNIGRGFIGEVFSESGYHVKFIDVNLEVIEALNREKRYPVSIVLGDGTKEVWVENVSGINGMEAGQVANAISECDLMATAVGVNILPRIVPNIVAGFRKRIADGNEKPLNIIICENLIDADKLLHQLITEQLGEDEKAVFEEKVGLVEASIGRMVPIMTAEQKQGNPLRVCVESYCELPVDKAAFKGEIPNVPHLYPFSPFEYYIKRKLFVHNMGHALTAYLGNLEGYQFIWQAIENSKIKSTVQKAMTESGTALSKRFDIPFEEITKHIDDLINRFGNKALGDTIERVGMDTKRKLSANDRFAGAIKLCEEQGITPKYISIGIAAGLLFKSDDDGTKEMSQMLRIKGLDFTLKELCSIDDNKYIKPYFEQLKKKNTVMLIKLSEEL
jgi:mannitol-1-phosphate 5-dehydrogenase